MAGTSSRDVNLYVTNSNERIALPWLQRSTGILLPACIQQRGRTWTGVNVTWPNTQHISAVIVVGRNNPLVITK